ncbi:MAG: cytochrome C [Acidimicrobiia bacterium]|nr:cytochrome C [Acidimicrobiia bacterium]
MKNFVHVAVVLMVVGTGVLLAQAPAGKDLLWAFPVGSAIVQGKHPIAEIEGPQTLPGSTLKYAQKEIENLSAPPDWFPGSHAPAPRIVRDGSGNGGFACGSCHLMNGMGHPESGDVQGLTVDYFVQTMRDYRSGIRKDPIRMTAIAQATSEADVREAAAWFATLKPVPRWSIVEERAMVPKTFLGPGRMRFADIDMPGTEPIGTRIITVPEDVRKAIQRDPRTGAGFVSYVPPGSLARGKALAAGGNGKTIDCTICHGEGLRGLGDVPRLANVHPIYLVRQLYNFQTGANNSAGAQLMKRVVAKLTDADIVDLAAYAGALPR